MVYIGIHHDQIYQRFNLPWILEFGIYNPGKMKMVSLVVTWSKRFRVTRRLGRIHGGDTTVTGKGKKGRQGMFRRRLWPYFVAPSSLQKSIVDLSQFCSISTIINGREKSSERTRERERERERERQKFAQTFYRLFSFVVGRREFELYFTTGFPLVKLTKLEEYWLRNARS